MVFAVYWHQFCRHIRSQNLEVRWWWQGCDLAAAAADDDDDDGHEDKRFQWPLAVMDNDSQDVNKTSQVIKCTWGCCGHSGSLGGTVHVVKRDEVSQGAGIGRAGEKREVRLVETLCSAHRLFWWSLGIPLDSAVDKSSGREWKRVLKLLCLSHILRPPFLAGSVHLQEPTWGLWLWQRLLDGFGNGPTLHPMSPWLCGWNTQQR